MPQSYPSAGCFHVNVTQISPLLPSGVKQLQLTNVSNIKSVTDLWNAIYTYVTDQEERSRSVDAFRKGQKDVLVATDVASKGLDFADVQHVINYDMPDDVENYGEFDMLIV